MASLALDEVPAFDALDVLEQSALTDAAAARTTRRDDVLGTDIEYIPPMASALELAAERCSAHIEESFYLVDLDAVQEQFRLFTTLLPRVHPYFAIKCNPNPIIIRLLGHLGANFDCASREEIGMVLEAGFGPDRIIFAHPCKHPAQIVYAREHGVRMMTFDNEDELRKIARIYPEATLVLRVAPDDSSALVRLSTKFGAPLGRVTRLLAVAKRLGLSVVGISYHVGSSATSSRSFTDAVRLARAAADIMERVGYTVELLDIGGGFPGTAAWRPSFSDIAMGIRPELDELFPDARIIAEPGRFFVARSHTLVAHVLARRIPTEMLADEAADVDDDDVVPQQHQRRLSSSSLGSSAAAPEPGAARAAAAAPAAAAALAASASAAADAASAAATVAAAAAAAAAADDADETVAAAAAAVAAAVTAELGSVVSYYLDEGVYGAFSCIIFDHQHPRPILLRRSVPLTWQSDSDEVEEARAAADDARTSVQLRRIMLERRAQMRGVRALDDGAGDGDDSAAGASTMTGGGGGGGGGEGSVLSADLPFVAGSAAFDAAPTYPSSVWGPTCDGIDLILDGAELPLLRIGDSFVFENMGAYTVASSCEFNGFRTRRFIYFRRSQPTFRS